MPTFAVYFSEQNTGIWRAVFHWSEGLGRFMKVILIGSKSTVDWKPVFRVHHGAGTCLLWRNVIHAGPEVYLREGLNTWQNEQHAYQQAQISFSSSPF